MRSIAIEQVREFFDRLSQQWTEPTTMRLIGGCALFFLGRQRTTLDIDYIGDDIHLTEFQRTAQMLAREMMLELEPVPLGEMIPISPDADTRSRLIGHFGSITVVAFDPYSIALSKLDRGTRTDIEDVAFLLDRGYVNGDALSSMVQNLLPQAHEYDLSPADMTRRLAAILKGALSSYA